MLKRIIVCLVALFLLTTTAFADTRTTLHSGYDEGKPVSDDAIHSILTSAFSMPTGGNQRALEFFVVTDRDVMKGMKGGNPWSQALDSAPCVIVVAADVDSAHYSELLEMDAGIAAGAMLIHAADLGLTTCVLSIAPQEERIASVRSALGTELLPILMIAVGYPAVDVTTSASIDNWDDAQVHWK
jgi:nitroreductase